MKFRVISIKTAAGAHSPFRVVEQDSGREVGWINRYLDREYVRRLANKSLYSYAHSLLHFVRRETILPCLQSEFTPPFQRPSMRCMCLA